MEYKTKAAHTKQTQFQIIVEFMQDHPYLAKGQLTLDQKNSANKLWKKLSEELNNFGPPVRDVVGWKKVWADYKSHLKVKIKKNKIRLDFTDGEPSTLCHLSPLEEEVLRLIMMEDTTSGTSQTHVRHELEEQQAKHEDLSDMEWYESNSAEKENTRSISPSTSISSERDLLMEMQVVNQIKYQEGSIMKLTEICNSLEAINENLRKTKEITEKKLQLAKEKYKHKQEMDREYLKLKREKLELKKLKLKMKAKKYGV